jgi:hypothetical protein
VSRRCWNGKRYYNIVETNHMSIELTRPLQCYEFLLMGLITLVIGQHCIFLWDVHHLYIKRPSSRMKSLLYIMILKLVSFTEYSVIVNIKQLWIFLRQTCHLCHKLDLMHNDWVPIRILLVPFMWIVHIR